MWLLAGVQHIASLVVHPPYVQAAVLAINCFVYLSLMNCAAIRMFPEPIDWARKKDTYGTRLLLLPCARQHPVRHLQLSSDGRTLIPVPEDLVNVVMACAVLCVIVTAGAFKFNGAKPVGHVQLIEIDVYFAPAPDEFLCLLQRRV